MMLAVDRNSSLSGTHECGGRVKATVLPSRRDPKLKRQVWASSLRWRILMFAALASLVVAGCGGAHDGQQVSRIIRAFEHDKHATPHVACEAQGRGESCVLTWSNGQKDQVTTSGPQRRGHPRLIVIR